LFADADILDRQQQNSLQERIKMPLVMRQPTGIRFRGFTLDQQTRQLLRGSATVHLPPKAFDLLTLLVQQRPAALSKTDIHKHLWPDTFVSDGNLALLIANIREALSDDARNPMFIRTVPRFGYAFVARATQCDSAPLPEAPSPACWLMRGQQTTPLAAGDNVVGRGPGVDIRVGPDSAANIRADATGVSRRHALFVVADDLVTVHDLASKNGTFVNALRIATPVALPEAADIRLGRLVIGFRRVRDVSTTQTLTRYTS
jgi:DNA-binding winged helix-turn-helix (wHTH) protein